MATWRGARVFVNFVNAYGMRCVRWELVFVPEQADPAALRALLRRLHSNWVNIEVERILWA